MDFSQRLFTLDHDGIGYRSVPLSTLETAGVPATIVLAAVKAELKGAIDVEAERRRLVLITPGSGQAMEYAEAQAQAAAALADPHPTAAAYPMLAASIGIDRDPSTGQAATDVAGVARSVLAARDAWLHVGAAIRAARLAAKAAIDAAATVVDAEKVEADWPALPG